MGDHPGPITTLSQHLYGMGVPSGRFKVGIATDPYQRRREIQTGNHEPVALAAVTDRGTCGVDPRDLEREVHQRLKPHRVTGEWFEIDEWSVLKAIWFGWTKLARPSVYERYLRRYGSSAAPT